MDGQRIVMRRRPAGNFGASRPLTIRAFSIAMEHRVMKTTVFVVSIVAAVMMVSTSSAGAKGCIKGAIVGGVAGHYAGHHGVLGAAAGCLYGRHHAKEQARQQQEQQDQNQQRRDAQGRI
jgi:hypothetical protein